MKREGYDINKPHGGIPISSKCDHSWSNKEMCFHQMLELIEKKITAKELIKRDFDRIK